MMNETTETMPTTSEVDNELSQPKNSAQFTTTLTLTELEQLLRRLIAETVREVVREELAKAHVERLYSMADDWNHTGQDGAEEEEALAEVIESWEKYKDDPEAFTHWEAFDTEQDQIDKHSM